MTVSPGSDRPRHLMQLDTIAGRVAQECLPCGPDRRRVAHVKPLCTEFGDDLVEVANLQRKVLADCRRRLGLDQVDLLASGVEPLATEPEVGTVCSAYQPKLLDVEARRFVGVTDVDRDVMHG